MPEREIDEEDTETAELQTTLRRFQRVTSSGSDKEDVQEDRRHRRVGSQEAEETEEDWTMLSNKKRKAGCISGAGESKKIKLGSLICQVRL